METVTLTLTVNELNIVGAALAKLPYEAVAALLDKVQKQAAQQLSPPPAPVPAE